MRFAVEFLAGVVGLTSVFFGVSALYAFAALFVVDVQERVSCCFECFCMRVRVRARVRVRVLFGLHIFFLTRHTRRTHDILYFIECYTFYLSL